MEFKVPFLCALLSCLRIVRKPQHVLPGKRKWWDTGRADCQDTRNKAIGLLKVTGEEIVIGIVIVMVITTVSS